jgi:hypothetical protein
MSRFLDGPAAGVSLLIKRAPALLRAVQKPDGSWDALDQFTDRPERNERIVVYRRVTEPATVHINRGRHGCGWQQMADYRVLAEQPADADVRQTSAWQAWANSVGRQHLEQIARSA